MAGPQTFSGTGIVYRADRTPLPGRRRYSFTLLPYNLPPLRGFASPPRPACMGCFVELFGREPLDLESEPLRLEMADGRSIRFFLFDVSETAPFPHAVIVDAWPEAAAAARADGQSGLRQSA